MKKRIIIILLFIIVICPILIYGKTDFNKIDAINSIQSYTNSFENSDKYLVTGSSIKYEFSSGILSTNSLYPRVGLLNRDEYLMAGEFNSYLFNPNASWMMTNYDGSNTYVVNKADLPQYYNNNSTAFVRSTVYIRNAVTLSGSGTMVDPWIINGLLCNKLTINLGNASFGGHFADSSTPLEYDLPEGDSVYIPNPVSDDYNFTGWSPALSGSTFTMGENDTTITAQWTPKKHVLTINLGGSTYGGYYSNSSTPLSYELLEGQTITVPSPISEDYNFTGWSPALSGSTFTMGENDTTITAQWSRKNYVLTVNLGTNAEFPIVSPATAKSYTLFSGGTVTLPVPMRKGYRFTGWTITSGTATVNNSTNVVTMGRSAATVSANWSALSYAYGYTGGVQTFTPTYTGYYQLEVWGAQGGPSDSLTTVQYGHTMWGGYGGYATGAVKLTAGVPIYITVGGGGGYAYYWDPTPYGGYNGGGRGIVPAYGTDGGNGAGGGATHISITASGVLTNFSSNYSSYVLIAAGGGGGSHTHSNAHNAGGSGGGYLGSSNVGFPWGAGRYNGRDGNCSYSTGGSQSTYGRGYNYCGANGAFGRGANSVGQVNYFGGAGGAGLWGGGAGGHGDTCSNSGSGGSGYIANSKLVSIHTNTLYNGIRKNMYCYKCQGNTSANTYTVSTTAVSTSPVSNYSKSGSGYAIIRYLSAN